MRTKTKMLCALYLIFIFTLSLSASFGGAISEIIYYLAFILPISLGLWYLYKECTKKGEFKEVLISDFKLSRDGAILSLPLFFPSIAVVCLISYLTAALMGLLGYENPVSINEPFICAVILHALLPAILEELLFRLLPMRFLEKEPKSAVIISSLFFAFAHANLFQIPYAFSAGIIFSVIYLISGSVIPSIALHFLNNFISLLSINTGKWVPIALVIAVLAIISLVGILKGRKTYLAVLSDTFKNEKIKLDSSIYIFIAVSLLLAISTLISS